MPIELRTQRDGRLRDRWYGRYEISGKRFYVNLDVKVAGQPPESLSLKDEGDAAFERSRATAQAKLDSIVAEARSRQTAQRLVEQLYEIKTGEPIKSVKLDVLAQEWERLPRKRKPNARYAAQCKAILGKFVAFTKAQNPKAEEMVHITRPLARAFMEAETDRGVTGKTWNDTLKLLRAAFKHLLPVGALNPFLDLPTRQTDTVFRKPFTPEELKAIVEAARADDFIRPILVTGMCTAMRRGDCCLLKWKDVDLPRGFITVKTAKTGQTVSIPVFPMLHDELTRRPAKGKDYVFPEQASMYRENPDGITWRVKKVLAAALGEVKAEPPALPEVSGDEARRRALDHIAKLPDSGKKERLKAVFENYMGGKSLSEVVAVTGVSKGTASSYLNEIEAAAGCRLVRGKRDGTSLAALLKANTTLLQADRPEGKRRASVRDFHSLRVTWVTLALTAGVPLELVQKVTGHKTTDIVLKHYFQPGREAFRQALYMAMPQLLTNGQKLPKDQLLEVARAMTAKTWKQAQARILELAEKL